MSADITKGVVSIGDIADIAGVTRGAVSNWRRRKKDFPQQVAGNADRPLFSLNDVTAWLEKHAASSGASVRNLPDEKSSDMWAWAAMNTLRDNYEIDDAATLFVALCAERMTGQPVDESFVRRARDGKQIESIRSMLADVELSDLAELADTVLEKAARSQGRQSGEHGFPGSRTSTLLANLAAAQRGEVLYDPACGIASAILEAVDRGAKPSRIVGHDINRASLLCAEQRATLRNVKVELTHTDVLSEDVDQGLRADVVLLDPPFNMKFPSSEHLMDPRFVFGIPPKSSADMAWIQHAIAHLAQDGTAYVLTPPSALFKGGAEKKIRAELLRQGCVEAVVALPARMLQMTSISVALWVLRRPRPADPLREVLLIDASATKEPENHVPVWLTTPSSLEGVPHVRVLASDILSQDTNLTPHRWVATEEPEPVDIAEANAETRNELKRALERFNERRELRPPLALDSVSRVVTIGDLEEVVDVQTGRAPGRNGEFPDGVRQRLVKPADIREGLKPVDSAGPGIANATEPGDILVSTMGRIDARVDETGGHVSGPGIYRIRVRDTSVLLPEYLAAAISGSWNNKHLMGATIMRAHVRDLEIPLIPMDAQRAAAADLQSLRDLSVEAVRVSHLAQASASTLMDTIRYNAGPQTRPASAELSVLQAGES